MGFAGLKSVDMDALPPRLPRESTALPFSVIIVLNHPVGPKFAITNIENAHI